MLKHQNAIRLLLMRPAVQWFRLIISYFLSRFSNCLFNFSPCCAMFYDYQFLISLIFKYTGCLVKLHPKLSKDDIDIRYGILCLKVSAHLLSEGMYAVAIWCDEPDSSSLVFVWKSTFPQIILPKKIIFGVWLLLRQSNMNRASGSITR